MHAQKQSTRRPIRHPFRQLVFVLGVVVVVAHAFGAKLPAQRNTAVPTLSSPTPHVQTRRDSMTVSLEPLARIEVKLVMKKGQKAEFSWATDGPEVTFNMHGEGPGSPGGKPHTYKRGESKGEKGEIVALFDGIHGWSWRNTSEKPVKIKVVASGQFSEIKKM